MRKLPPTGLSHRPADIQPIADRHGSTTERLQWPTPGPSEILSFCPSDAFKSHYLQCNTVGLKLAAFISLDDIVKITLPEKHPDLKRIVEATHHDIAAKSEKGNSLANALSAELGKAPG